MRQKEKILASLSGGFLLLFLLLVVLLKTVDVQPIGPNGSLVGLASINGLFFRLTGYQPLWYEITDLLGKAALLIALGFMAFGLIQLVKGRSLRNVDASLYVLGGTYVLTALAYILFELVVINCRPVLQDGVLEASFPSSHTMLSCVIASTAMLQGKERLRSPRAVTACYVGFGLLLAVIVTGRLLSGVHWFTDILGGVLLGAALTAGYAAACAAVLDRR